MTDPNTPVNTRSIPALEAHLGGLGDIILRNPTDDPEDATFVRLHPEQVDQVIAWLNELKPQALQAKKRLQEEYDAV